MACELSGMGMIKNYFLITLRSLAKNKVFIFINVFGMGIAIACCIVAFLAYAYNSNFDALHVNGSRIYRVTSVRDFENTLTRHGVVPMPLGQIVSKNFGDVNRSTRYFRSYSNLKREDDLFASNLSYVDPDFFEMFTFEFISGRPADLNDKASLFISAEMASRLYKNPAQALDRTVTQVLAGELREFKIAGVFKDPPMNTSFYHDGGSCYANFENMQAEFPTVREDDWRQSNTVFLQIDDPARVNTVHAALQGFAADNNRVREDFIIKEFLLEPLPGMAIKDRIEYTEAWTWVAPPQSAIIGSSIMGVLILLIACFNLTNTAVAISSKRLKEIGLRKVMGGMRAQLIVQFIGETTFICFLALVVGLGFSDLLVQGWNMMWQYMQLTPRDADFTGFLIFLTMVLLVTGILAGSYPAFYISRFEPIGILKGKLKFGGTNVFTRVLLGLQFMISIIAIVSAIGFYQNSKFQRDYDLGYDGRGPIITWINSRSEFDTYRNALQSNPEILSIAGARSGLFSGQDNQTVKVESKQAEVRVIEVGHDYLETMNFKLLEGRNFMRDSKTDERESIIVTEAMAKLFDWTNPVGRQVTVNDSVRLVVVGMVKDVYTQGLWRELEPMMIRFVLPERYTQLVVSTRSESVSRVNDFMRKQWSAVFPNRLYNGYMIAWHANEVHNVNMNIMYMYIFLGLVALMLSTTGLFSLVSLNIIRRMKEIGVRKVLGASVANIARVINAEFFVVLTLASALGCWMSYAMCNALMKSIWRYFQPVNGVTFVTSVVVLFVIAAASVGYKIFTVATMNPVNTLKDE